MLRLSVDNKDQIDDIIITEDTILDVNLFDCSEDINIEVMDNMCLEVFEKDINTSNNIIYNLRNNAQVIVNKICKNNNDNTIVNLNGEGSNVKYNSSILNYSDNNYKFLINHNASYTESNVFNHAVNFTNSDFKLLIDASVKKQSVECYSNQDNKIIDMGNGKNYITPNLLVDNELVNANHSAYIGRFDKDVIFYLKSRGIREEDINDLLIKGFLLGKMNLEEKEKEEFETFIVNNINK